MATNKKSVNAKTNAKKSSTVKKSNGTGTMKKAIEKAVGTTKEKDPRVNSDRVVRTGTIKFMDIRKGYGFIIDSETGEEVFFHHTGIETGRIYKGYMPEDEVSYCVGPTDRGPEAFGINMEKASTGYHRKKAYQQNMEEDAGEIPEGLEEEEEDVPDDFDKDYEEDKDPDDEEYEEDDDDAEEDEDEADEDDSEDDSE